MSTHRTSASRRLASLHAWRAALLLAQAALFVLALCSSSVARAHAPTFAVYSKVEATTIGDRVAFVFGIDKLPMTELLQRDAAHGPIALADVGQYRAFVSRYLFDRFTVANGGVPCDHPGELSEFAWDEKVNYVIAVTTFTCRGPLTDLAIHSLVTHDIPYPHELVADLLHGSVIVRHFFAGDDVEEHIDLLTLPPSGIVTPWRPKRRGVISYVPEPRPNRIFERYAAAELGVDIAALQRAASAAGAVGAGSPSPAASAAPDAERAPSLLSFIGQGILHIFTGFDHVLFIVTLMLVVRSWKHLAVVVTSFTAAHSLTLAVATLGIVTLPSRVVEPLIALTVLVVAVDAIVRPDAKARALVAFGFGLIHGLGLSNALRELGLSGRALVPALFGFNVGVEIGQLLIVCPLFGLVLWLRKREPTFVRVRNVLCASVAVVAVFWIVVRVREAFLG